MELLQPNSNVGEGRGEEGRGGEGRGGTGVCIWDLLFLSSTLIATVASGQARARVLMLNEDRAFLYSTALIQHCASQLSSVQLQHVRAQELSARHKQEETKRNSTLIYF